MNSERPRPVCPLSAATPSRARYVFALVKKVYIILSWIIHKIFSLLLLFCLHFSSTPHCDIEYVTNIWVLIGKTLYC